MKWKTCICYRWAHVMRCLQYLDCFLSVDTCEAIFVGFGWFPHLWYTCCFHSMNCSTVDTCVAMFARYGWFPCGWHFLLLCLQGLDDDQIKAAAIDIFSFIVEFSPSMVREFILQEGQKSDDVSIIVNFDKALHVILTGCVYETISTRWQQVMM